MSADVHEGQLPSDRMMEYDYAMGQDCLASGQYEDAVMYFRKQPVWARRRLRQR